MVSIRPLKWECQEGDFYNLHYRAKVFATYIILWEGDDGWEISTCVRPDDLPVNGLTVSSSDYLGRGNLKYYKGQKYPELKKAQAAAEKFYQRELQEYLVKKK